MADKLNILIADDHEYFLDGLQIGIEQHLQNHKIFRANNGYQIIDIIEKNDIDILFTDIQMPKLDGIKTLMKLQSTNKHLKIAVITSYYDIQHIKPLTRLGVKVILDKENVKTEIEYALQALLNKRSYYTPLVENTINEILQGKKKSKPKSAIPVLTKREKELFGYFIKGMTNKEIAQVVPIDPKTIDSHRSNIYFKFDVNSAAKLIAKALDYGMID